MEDGSLNRELMPKPPPLELSIQDWTYYELGVCAHEEGQSPLQGKDVDEARNEALAVLGYTDALAGDVKKALEDMST